MLCCSLVSSHKEIESLPKKILNFLSKYIYLKPNKFNRMHSLNYLRYTTLGCKDIGIIKTEFVAKLYFFRYNKFKTIKHVVCLTKLKKELNEQ